MAHERYADDLETPHPIRAYGQDEPPEKLSVVISNQDFGDQLAAITDPAERQENALAAAHVVCSQVREALWFPEKAEDFEVLDIEPPISLDHLPERQAGDCFAFTIVASECLEISGIDHWIGFANGHGTLILPTEGGRELNLVDPLSPVLSQNLHHSMVTGGSEGYSVNDDMREFGRSAVELNSLSLASRAEGNTVELLTKHHWLIFTRGEGQDAVGTREMAQAIVWGQDVYGNASHPSRSRIFMSVFMPEEGRQMLHDYDSFQQSYYAGEYMDAATSIYRMHDAYPDLDARQSHSRVKAIVRLLAKSGSANYARKLLDGYFESFALMEDDSRVPEAHADCLAAVAREAGDAEAAGEAIELYETALGYDKVYREAVAGKLAKTTAFAARLHTEPLPT